MFCERIASIWDCDSADGIVPQFRLDKPTAVRTESCDMHPEMLDVNCACARSTRNWEFVYSYELPPQPVCSVKVGAYWPACARTLAVAARSRERSANSPGFCRRARSCRLSGRIFTGVMSNRVVSTTLSGCGTPSCS